MTFARSGGLLPAAVLALVLVVVISEAAAPPCFTILSLPGVNSLDLRPYQASTSCAWTLSADDPSERLVLTFDAFETEACCDRLTIHDGPSTDAPIIAILSGTALPAPIASTADTLTLSFVTDASFQLSGWRATWATEGNPCNGATTLTSPATNNLISSSTPLVGDYPPNANCQWIIDPSPTALATAFGGEVPSDARLRLDISTVDLGAGDSLVVRDGKTAGSPLLSGIQSQTASPVFGNDIADGMFVSFTADATGEASGFLLKWGLNGALCGGVVDGGAPFEFSLPAPRLGVYGNNLQCAWRVTNELEPTAAMSVVISGVDLGPGDTLSVYDGTSATGTPILTLNETTPASGAAVDSFSPTVFIVFVSDGTGVGSGFDVSTASIGGQCGGIKSLTDPATDGTVEVPARDVVPLVYDPNLDCGWVVGDGVGSENVAVFFSQFALHPSETVHVYDGASSDATPIASFTSTAPPPLDGQPAAVSSDGVQLFVEFSTDGSGTDSGFVFTWQTGATFSGTPCAGATVFDATTSTADLSGRITSHAPFIGEYGNNANCSWTVIPPANTLVRLEFRTFELSHLDAFTIANASGAILQTFLSTSAPPVYTTPGPGPVTLHFESNGADVATGVDIVWSVVGELCSGTTSLTLTAPIGIGSIVPHVGISTDAVTCTWSILSDAPVNFQLDDFAAGSPDIINIYDGLTTSAGNLIVSLSDGSLGDPDDIISSSGNSLTIVYTSAAGVATTGFAATVAPQGTPCSGNVFITSGRSGRISNPSPFNALYGNDATCLWAVDLSGAGSDAIVVEVSTFETMAGDFLIIYDGLVADDGAVLANYEGTVTDAAPFTTAGPRMLVRFESDAAGVGRGFDLTWTQDYLGESCSGVVTLDATSGSFSVLASPIGRYAAGTECTWHITGPAGTTLELSFPDVDLDDDDTVAVHDGVDNDAPIIGFFVSTTGSNQHVESSGSDLTVIFSADANSGGGRGFSASYFVRPAPCALFTPYAPSTGSGTLASGLPFGTFSYGQDLICIWSVTTVHDATVTLRLPSGFDLDPNCLRNPDDDDTAACDAVTVFDGPSTAGPALDTLSGTSGGAYQITSSGPSLVIMFSSDSVAATDGLGFQAEWEAVGPCDGAGCTTSECVVGDCPCMVGFAGDRCEICAPDWDGYPLCSACGNGKLNAGETCDDGGETDGDGCSVDCQVEDDYVCAGEPSVCSPTLTYSGTDVHVRFVDPPEMLTSAGAAAAILAVLEGVLSAGSWSGGLVVSYIGPSNGATTWDVTVNTQSDLSVADVEVGTALLQTALAADPPLQLFGFPVQAIDMVETQAPETTAAPATTAAPGTTTVAPTEVPTTTPQPSNAGAGQIAGTDAPESGLSDGAKFGIVIGVVVLICAICVAVAVVQSRREEKSIRVGKLRFGRKKEADGGGEDEEELAGGDGDYETSYDPPSRAGSYSSKNANSSRESRESRDGSRRKGGKAKIRKKRQRKGRGGWFRKKPKSKTTIVRDMPSGTEGTEVVVADLPTDSLSMDDGYDDPEVPDTSIAESTLAADESYYSYYSASGSGSSAASAATTAETS